MGPTRSGRDAPASGGQTGTLGDDTGGNNVSQATIAVPGSALNSNLGTTHDSTQVMNQVVSSQSTPALSAKKPTKSKWRRYSPGFKVRAVRLTRAIASDGTRIGLRRAAMVLGIRHDAIVVWQRHFDSLRGQAINLNEPVDDDISELVYRVWNYMFTPLFFFLSNRPIASIYLGIYVPNIMLCLSPSLNLKVYFSSLN